MDEEDQIAADFAPGVHDVPEDVLTSYPDAPLPDSFDDSQAYLHGQGSDAQKRLSEVQAAQDKIQRWLTTFHGSEPKTSGNLRQQVASGKISGSDYFAMTGRIYAGGTGDTAIRDTQGRITGYASPGSTSATPGLDDFHAMQGTPLGTNSSLSDASGTPGLDALHAMQGESRFSPLPASPTPLPGSVAARVGPVSPGLAMAADTLRYDTRLQAPTAASINGPTPDGTRRNQTGNDRMAEAAWKTGQGQANAAVRANFRAAGLPDPTISASVLNTGGGTSVVPGNWGARPNGYPRVPSSIWG